MEEFVTNDTNYAATLLAAGFVLFDCRIDNNKHYFCFNVPSIPDLKSKHVNNSLLISAIRTLKSYTLGDFCLDFCNPKTSDLFFAAFLRANNVELTGTSKVGNRFYFHFRPFNSEKEIKKLRIEFISGSFVNSGNFISCVKRLKPLVHGV